MKIPDGILLELLPAFCRDSAQYSCWNSTGILPECQTNFRPEFLCHRNFCSHSTGILHSTPAGIPQEFYQHARLISSRNSCATGIFVRIPPGFCIVLQLEFQAYLQPEFLWKFRLEFARIILLAFRQDSALYSSWNCTGILPEFQTNFQPEVETDFEPDFLWKLRIEFHWNYCWHSTRILHCHLSGIPVEFSAWIPLTFLHLGLFQV